MYSVQEIDAESKNVTGMIYHSIPFMRNVHYFFPHFRWNSTVYVHGNDLHLISTLSLNSDHAQSCTCE